MKFKPTKKKVIISLVIPLLIIFIFLIIIELSNPICIMRHDCKGDMLCIETWEHECSAFEIAYNNIEFFILLYIILCLLTYLIYSLFERKIKRKD